MSRSFDNFLIYIVAAVIVTTAWQIPRWLANRKGRLILQIDNAEIVHGDVVTGTVTLSCTKTIPIRALTMQLLVIPRYATGDISVVKSQLCGGEIVKAGEQRSFPFRMRIPGKNEPGYYSSMLWRLRARLETSGLDLRTSRRIYVGRKPFFQVQTMRIDLRSNQDSSSL